MGVKFSLKRVSENEADSIAEWFNITDRVFKIAGWLLMLGVINALYLKTQNFVFLAVFLFLLLFLSKLFFKATAYKIFIHTDRVLGRSV